MYSTISFSNLTRRLEIIKFSLIWSERYRPVKQEITKFDENSFDKKWLTQYHFGCLLFALLNGNFLDSNWKKYFDFNLDFSNQLKMNRSKKQIIIGVVHEYKAILLWRLLTENNVVHGNLNNIKLMIHQMLESKSLKGSHCSRQASLSLRIHQMLESKSLKEIYETASTLSRLYNNKEERFAVKIVNGKKLDFAEGDWAISNRRAIIMEETRMPKLLSIKLRYLERLPRYSLFCLNDHWITFLGCKDDKMIFYDSYLHNRLRIFPKKFVMEHVVSVLLSKGGN